jgi:hypothetical protein
MNGSDRSFECPEPRVAFLPAKCPDPNPAPASDPIAKFTPAKKMAYLATAISILPGLRKDKEVGPI